MQHISEELFVVLQENLLYL